MDDTFQTLMQRLGSAINDAILTSDAVDSALADVRETGIDIFLVLEATICVRQQDGESLGDADGGVDSLDATDLTTIEMSSEDRQFLKRLRISVENDEDRED